MSAPPHLLVVDDDARMRALLTRYLTRNAMLVTEARGAAQARAIMAGLRFDLIVLDMMMPGEDGIRFATRLRAETPPGDAPPILMLTARGEVEDRLAGLEAGVDDYLVKPFEPRELVLRIQAILRRAPQPEDAAPPMLFLGEARLDPARGEMWRGPEPVKLTTSEQALLRLLAQTPHEPVPRSALSAALGGEGEEPGERAVDVQMTRLRRKLGDDPRQQRWLRTVRGEGYMLTPE